MKSDIIYAPVITEKTSALAQANTYVFKVAKHANKIQIKDAIEETFGVKVASVNTLNTKPKKKRVGRYSGLSNRYKKAIVQIREGETIDIG